MPHTLGRIPLILALLALPAWAASYRLDPGRTLPQFELDHLWFFTERGWFNHVRGDLEYDATQRSGRLVVVIDACSLDTRNDERDRILKGPDWFDVGHYRTITFRSQRFLFNQDRLAAVEGTLTMLGVSRPMRLEVDRIQCESQPTGTQRCSAEAHGTLRRSGFGMRTGLPFIGDEVRLRIQAMTHPEQSSIEDRQMRACQAQ